MKTQSSMLHVRMDSEVKRKARVKVPNRQTRRAMAESEEMMRQSTARFANADEMFTDLEEASGQ